MSISSRCLRFVALSATLVLLGGGVRVRAAVFTVSNTTDSGPGSLRQAILDSNAASGPNIIEIAIAGTPPFIIRPQEQFFPPIKGPAVLRVRRVPDTDAPAAPRAPVVVLDGSNVVKPRTPSECPGATASYNPQTNRWESSNVNGTGPNVRGYYGAGLAVHDSHDVEISGLEIRNFCIGVATVRSHDVNIHDMRIVDNHGAAGVIFTGDDGSSGRTDLSFNNRLTNSTLLDNGDGFEFTRGTHDSVIQGNTIALTQPLPVDGNAVEFATSGDRNTVIGNTFTKYVEVAVTVGGSNHIIRDNKFLQNKGLGMRASGNNLQILGNTFIDNGVGLSISGSGSRLIENVVSGNGGQGVVVGGPNVTLSRNSIYNNGRLGIDSAPAAANGGRRGATPAGASSPSAAVSFELPAAPVLAPGSKWTANGIVMMGSVTAAQRLPNQTYTIEVFASRAADRHPAEESGWGEGEKYLGTATATTDAAGNAMFSLSLAPSDPFGEGRTEAFFTATAADSTGSTSKFSRALSLHKEER